MPPKLLLADDSITVQRVIALTFAGEGLEVVTVGDGDQAVERIARDQPEIVLADVSMPGRDGYAVAEFVKRSVEHATRTRVVLLTGAFEPVDEARTRLLGIDGVLAKPFEPQMAIGLVRRLLDQPPVAASPVEADVETAGVAATATGFGALGEASALGAGSGLAAGYPFEPRAEEKPAPSQLDDYFRRLDEALATAGLSSPPAPAPESHAPEAHGGETHGDAPGAEETFMIEPTSRTAAPYEDAPTLIMSPRREAAMFDSPIGEADPREDASAAAPSDAAPSDATPSAPMLVDAFAALLAVEQGEPGATVPDWPAAAAPASPAHDSPVTPSPSATVDTEAIVEAVTRRVLERMTDAVVREVVTARVLEVAERAVREEIERIKAQAEE
jgi:CheY-like chemotaxis protein